MLQIRKTVTDGKAILAPAGRLDTLTSPAFDAAIKEIAAKVDELTLDLAELEYISSAGLRVLLTAQKAMAVRGKMTVKNPNETVSEIFEVTGFRDILNIE